MHTYGTSQVLKAMRDIPVPFDELLEVYLNLRKQERAVESKVRYAELLILRQCNFNAYNTVLEKHVYILKANLKL